MEDDGSQSLLAALRGTAEGLTLADVGEKSLLREFLLPLCRSICGDHGLGDDSGVINPPVGTALAVTTDRVPTDLLAIQFGQMSGEELGRYLLKVNVSDLVAAGAKPMASAITASFPPELAVVRVLEIMFGAYAESVDLGCPVIVGDTKASTEASLSATAFGFVPPGRSLTRGPIEPGMTVYCTGTLAQAGTALRWFRLPTRDRDKLAGSSGTRLELDDELRPYLVAPRPRVDLIPSLQSAQPAACMDISDGLGQSLRELSQRSSVGIELDADAVPVEPTVRSAMSLLKADLREVLGGIGLDLELVVINHRMTDTDNFTPIGTVVQGDGVRWSDGESVRTTGFQHFTAAAIDFLD